MPHPDSESEISRDIRISIEAAMDTIYSYLSTNPCSKYFGERKITQRNLDRKTLGEIYDSAKQTE